MSTLTLDLARTLTDKALAKGRELGLKPLTVVVLDQSGEIKYLVREDGSAPLRPTVARGKARAALALSTTSRAIAEMAAERPSFVAALATAAPGDIIPAAGGVLIKHQGEIIGAVGISGDLSDQDEICALAGIAAAGLES
ncbi:MAG: heme-binding protein [Candidatus Competibacterales bacterium]